MSEDDWDAAFLDELIQAEERVISSSASSSSKAKPSYLAAPSQLQSLSYHNPPPHHGGHGVTPISYSPPRELTQKPPVDKSDRNGAAASSSSNDIAKEEELRRLKRELEERSKQLAQLERECSELKKERIKRDEQAERLPPRRDVNSSKARNLEHKAFGVDTHGYNVRSEDNEAMEDRRRDRLASCSRAVGIQTDTDDDPLRGDVNNGGSSRSRLTEKLLSVWGSTSHQQSGKNLVSKLLMDCGKEFRVLFGTMSLDMHSAVGASSAAAKPAPTLHNHVHGLCPSDATKVSDLYNVIIKISNGLLKQEALFGPLFDLCSVKNVEMSHSGLCILHIFLTHLLRGRKPRIRNNVKVLSKDTVSSSENGISHGSIISPLACLNWHSLFELMHQIAVENSKECIRLEAISIIRVIVTESNASTEREQFGTTSVLQSLAQFLKRESGSSVQKEAVDLLFLLLNCPKILNSFCSGCHEEDRNISTCTVYSLVLSGLAECISCSRNSIQDIELCKRAIATLAFLAASEKSGYEILVSHRLVGGTNFLMMILKELSSEESDSSEPVEKLQARTMMFREALILLNRLVSNLGSSAIVLRVLTGSREMASLTLEVASRLSEEQMSGYQGQTTAGESEIVDLAKKFKKRVFAYLGSVVD